MKELTIFKGVESLRQKLSEFTISNKADAIKFIHLKSLFGAKDIGERLANEAKEYLLTKCKDCDIYEAEGLSLVKVSPKLRIYNFTEELQAAEADVERLTEKLAEAKEELENCRNRAGFTETEGAGKPYFKVKI